MYVYYFSPEFRKFQYLPCTKYQKLRVSSRHNGDKHEFRTKAFILSTGSILSVYLFILFTFNVHRVGGYKLL